MTRTIALSALSTLSTLVLLAAPSAALAAPVELDFAFLVPPPLDLAGYSTLGVSGIDGFESTRVEDAIVAALLDDSRGLPEGVRLEGADGFEARANHFPVVERSRLSTVLGEQDLGGAISEETRARLGEVMGAGILITGTSLPPTAADAWSTKTVSKKVGDDWVKVNQHCLTRTVEVTLNLRALDATTGQILLAESVANAGAMESCAGSQDEAVAVMAAPAAIALELLPPLGYAVANQVAPRWVIEQFRGERNKDTKEGIKLLKKERDLAAAAVEFRDGAQGDAYNDWLQYHAALTLAVGFHFDAAAEHLAAARAIKDRPPFRKLDERLGELRAHFDTLSDWGLPLAPIELGGAAASAAADAVETVRVKGNRKARVALTTEPGGGATVVEVPGAMTLTVLESRDGYVFVQTFDGKEGWLASDDVK